jgi:hypothetical protein
MMRVFEKQGRGLTRAEVAQALGKNQLNPVDKAALDSLVAAGKLKRTSKPAGRGNILKFVYRLKERAIEK